MSTSTSPPTAIAGIAVPRDEVSQATWAWAGRNLPRYLFAHSVRTYCWGATLAEAEGWTFDRRLFWTASLLHDYGLTRLARNTMCFEFEGAEIARRLLERFGMPADEAVRAAIAIILHMQPGVTLDDGVEAVLLDRATAIDVRGAGYEQIEAVAGPVADSFPRDDFDRHFLAAIRREAAERPSCQSARLGRDLGEWMARSPWARAAG